MYLNKLDQKEKEYFLDLAYYVATVDKNFSEEEQKLITAYCDEMDIKKHENKSLDLDFIIKQFSKNVTKNIVMLEILALAFADGDYNLQEIKTITKIQKAFGFSDEKMLTFINWVKNIIKVYQEGDKLVYG